MYADQSLTPKEAIRLCALGLLVEQPVSYGALAVKIRHFVSRVIGPTNEIMGHSIEVLRYEGLVSSGDGEGDEAPLVVTDAGLAELHRLLTARIRAASTELNRLIIALKFRFLHLLQPSEQDVQLDRLLDAAERELARLDDLHGSGDRPTQGLLDDWLDFEVRVIEERIGWIRALRNRLAAAAG